ncbi:RAMP superfamily CRISPR-associated protein [Nocardia sp. CA-119907]|uniref:RAMP superfamily CRISPR-associated protein n=1 Tax=Nocardia sp. CA-119907 TaxID=3239973 RepID=UPI003D95D2D2
MTELRFRIEFATPLRVSTGHAGPGVDAAIDPTDPLPATSLKGVMRATTIQLLGPDHPHVAAVFGSPAAACPWEWSNAAPVSGTIWQPPRRAARIRINEHHVADHDMLAVTEQTHTSAATFTIRDTGSLDDADHALHIAVLAVAGQATRSLGANRRRGLGWVHITCTTHPPGPEQIHAFLHGGPA